MAKDKSLPAVSQSSTKDKGLSYKELQFYQNIFFQRGGARRPKNSGQDEATCVGILTRAIEN